MNPVNNIVINLLYLLSMSQYLKYTFDNIQSCILLRVFCKRLSRPFRFLLPGALEDEVGETAFNAEIGG